MYAWCMLPISVAAGSLCCLVQAAGTTCDPAPRNCLGVCVVGNFQSHQTQAMHSLCKGRLIDARGALHNGIGPTLGVTRASRALAPQVDACAAAAVPVEDVDVVVVGSGIIGLCVARKILSDTSLSVTLFDKRQPCAGATGAGQGYIWLAHRDPVSPSWPLARRSKALWEQLAAHAGSGGHTGRLADNLEWQDNGSLMLATTADEVRQLEVRAAMLQQQGIPGVVLLSPRELKMHEPALHLPTGSTGLLTRSDAQLNGKHTAFAMLDDCQQIAAASSSCQSTGPQKRFQVCLNEGVTALEPLGEGQGVDVVTEKRRVRAHQGVVVAAGVWSGPLLADSTGQAAWRRLLQPRRGHLLELKPPAGMPMISTGMMELSYTQHYATTTKQQQAAVPATATADTSSSNSSSSHAAVDITFTATSSSSGTLLIGSSREFSGWEAVPSKSIISAIMDRAASFLPHLSSITADELLDSTRVGLRPYAVGGLPAVGLVPGLPGVAVAAGHEGSGLCLGPATAELVLHHLLGLELLQQEVGGVNADSLAVAGAELSPDKRLSTCVAADCSEDAWLHGTK